MGKQVGDEVKAVNDDDEMGAAVLDKGGRDGQQICTRRRIAWSEQRARTRAGGVLASRYRCLLRDRLGGDLTCGACFCLSAALFVSGSEIVGVGCAVRPGGGVGINAAEAQWASAGVSLRQTWR